MTLFEVAKEFEKDFTSHYWRFDDVDFIDKIFKPTTIIFGDFIVSITLQDIITNENYTIYNDEPTFWTKVDILEVVLF